MTECFLSRMDVVGYSNIYRKNPKAVNRILDHIVRRLRSELKRYNQAAGTENGLRFHQMYGDTLDISFETGDNDQTHFLALLDVTCMIQRELLKEGLMVRGAIVRGDLIDNPRLFTGMAMVEAAALEKGLDSPHIRLDKNAMKMLRSSIPMLFPNEKDQKTYLKQTIYEENKLDFLNHVPYVIPYDMHLDLSLQTIIERVKETSIKSITDDHSRETS